VNENSIETLSDQIRRLVLQRQALRASSAGRELLEANRLELVRSQWEFSYALIERHGRRPKALRAA
jgi:hypothetical protein